MDKSDSSTRPEPPGAFNGQIFFGLDIGRACHLFGGYLFDHALTDYVVPACVRLPLNRGLFMDTSFSNSVGNHGTPISEKSVDKIRDVQQSVKDAGATIANKVDSVVGQAKYGLDSVKDAVQQTRKSASESSEALINYTKENPVKALMIAAASGALLWTVLKAVAPSRD